MSSSGAPEVPMAPGGGPGRPTWFVPAVIGVAVLVLAALVALVATAGKGGGSSDVSAAGSSTTTTAADTTTTVAPAGGDASSTTAAGAATTTTTTAAPAGANASATTAPTTTARAAATTTTTAKAGGGDLGAAKDPGPGAPPRPGSYRYHVVTGSGDQRDVTVKIETVSDSPNKSVRKVSGSQGGFDATSTVEFTPDKVLVTETTFHVQGNDGRCDWQPDILQTKLPLATGSTWSSDSSCTITFGATPVTVVAKSQSKVLGLERRRVAGKVLDLWVIQSKDHYEFAGNTIDATSKTYVSPPHGLVVRTEASGSGTSAQGSGDGSYTSEILNLDPA